MNDDDWAVIGDKAVLVFCLVVIVLYFTGVLR